MSDPLSGAGDARASPPTLSRHDIWSGAVFTVLGVIVAFESWRMPRLSERGIDPWTAPGVVPGFLGVVLAGLGIVLLMRGVRETKALAASTPSVSIFGRGEGRRFVFIALALNLVYALVLIGRVPFAVATFGYLITFMIVFGLAATSGAVGRRIAVFSVISALATLGIVVLFQTLFLVRLP